MESQPNWGPTGKAVYERTYRRFKSDGEPESWLDTVTRVVDGNLALVSDKFIEKGERQKLIDLFYNFQALPAGRHIWMSGVPGRQFLFNCHHSGWADEITTHYCFTFDQLMQGGGVGANYSNKLIKKFKPVKHPVEVHIVCDPEHPDIDELRFHREVLRDENNWPVQDGEGNYVMCEPFSLLSDSYSHEWDGATRVEDSREGWSDALAALLDAFWNGLDVLVLDLSLIRCRGSKIKTFGGTAAGPAPLANMLRQVAQLLSCRVGEKISSLDAMRIDHYIAECVVSGNVRRSARMSIKSWADGDILDFIHCKENPLENWSTNISVEIDEGFFRALKRKDAHAKRVYKEVVAGMLNNGEPGFYNRSRAQVGEIGEVASTNPCGEIPLEEFENCNLGHVNLDSFWNDFSGAVEAHRLMTRYLVRATFGDVPNPLQRAVLDRNRRIGVGHLGFQGWLNKQGIRYSDSYQDPHIRKTLRDFYQAVRKEAHRYAFLLRIPEPIKVTTVAPTGTIAKMPGKSEGIHPIYAKYFIRRVRYSTVDPGQIEALRQFELDGYHIEDDIYTPNTKVVEFVTMDTLVEEVATLGLDADYLVEAADEIELADMLGVQAMYQECYADNAVSFTVNIPPDTYTVKEGMDTLIHYLPRLKGTTIMIDGSRPQSPYERITKAQYLAHTNQEVGDGINEECATGACPVK